MKNDGVFLDIDYIFEWVLDKESNIYSFWISPATLLFNSPSNLRVSISTDFVNGLEISDIHQKVLGNGLFEYHVETQEGDIELTSSGYRQCMRKPPLLVASQYLAEADRDGYPLHIDE